MEGVSTIDRQLYRKDIDTYDGFTTQLIISDTIKLNYLLYHLCCKVITQHGNAMSCHNRSLL